MSQVIPENLAASPAIQFITSQGWNWKGGDGGQIQVESCPFCRKSDYKFYVAVQDPRDGNRDGLYFCHHGACQKTGNLKTLKEHLGLVIPGVESRKEWADGKRPVEALPDPDVCHGVLLGDAEAMDYLLNVRRFSAEVISKYKLGIKEGVKFHKAGSTKALVIPYLVNGNMVYAKYRTLPYLTIKDFISPYMGAGFDVPLYNVEVLQEGLSEVVLVEGEADTLACLSNGIANVVGVPGAGVKKAMWIETLDRLDPKIYILFDADGAGSKGAQELASRIGINRCYKIVLPPFKVPFVAEDGPRERDGKDVNEWFVHGGGTLEKFEELKKNAQLFNVTGVMGTMDAIALLEEQLAGKTDLAPTYVSKWPSLNRLVGFEGGDVIDILGPEKQGKTTLALNIIDDMVEAYHEPGLFICLEMTHERLARKHVAKLTGFEDVVSAPGSDEAKQKLQDLIKACAIARDMLRERKADLYFAYPQGLKNPEDLYKFIVDCIRRYGVKWIVFDNLQRFCDDTLVNQAHRTVHLSQISKGLAKIPKDWPGVKLIRLLQPRQIGDNEIIKSTHTDGSSQVRKDCDCLITIWRNSTGETKRSAWEKDQGLSTSDESFEPRMRLGLDLSRYSSGGHCTLYFDGARSFVREYTEEERRGFSGTSPAAANFNGIIEKEPEAAVPNMSTTVPVVSTPSIPTEGEITI